MKRQSRTAPRDTPVRDLGLVFRRFWSTVLRSRCPACGRGRIARNHFRLMETCNHCGARYERDPGSWLVSLALNYFITSLVVGLAALVLILNYGFFPALTWVLVALACVTPLLIFRHVKALQLWLLWAFGFVYPD